MNFRSNKKNVPSIFLDDIISTDKDGNSVVPPIYQGILPHSEGRAAFAIDGKIGFFDENWNVCIDAKYYCNQLPFSDFFFSFLSCVIEK